MRTVLAATAAVLFLACASEPRSDLTRCSADETAPCECAGGGVGTMRCEADGRYGNCSCGSVNPNLPEGGERDAGSNPNPRRDASAADASSDAGTSQDASHDASSHPTDGGVTDSATSNDAAQQPDSPPRDSGPAGCVANHDGSITANEIPFRAGLRATYRVGRGAAFRTEGVTVNGVRQWDLSGSFAGDHDVVIELQSPTGTWWTADHPNVDYAQKLSDQNDLIGLFSLSSQSLVLRGVVSPSSTGGTDLEHAPAPTFMALPLELNKTWASSTHITGSTALYPVAVFDEDYDSKVDARGRLITPAGTFEVHRITTTVTRYVAFQFPTYVRTYAFVSECFGTVANVISEEMYSTPGAEITQPAELWRLGR